MILVPLYQAIGGMEIMPRSRTKNRQHEDRALPENPNYRQHGDCTLPENPNGMEITLRLETRKP
jgi:hypothetical protein